MASITARVATALSIVAIQITSKPKRCGPVGACCMFLYPSDLEVDHFGHDESADAHPYQATDSGDLKPRVAEEAGHVGRVHQVHEREYHERQRADDVGRGLRFRAHRADLELHLRALAKHVGK